MSLTKFGEAIRRIRGEGKITLSKMANDLGTSAAFLSAMETGRSKVPMEWVSKIGTYFLSMGKSVDLQELKIKACESNESVSLEGLPPQHKMLVAGFANSNFNQEQLSRLGNLLADLYREGEK